MKSLEPIYFVYEHWRPDRDECFYVGKGSGKRSADMHRRGPHHKAIQAKLAALGMCAEVRMVAEALTEDEAFAFEIERIAFWRSDGAGLANKSKGGEGPSGHVHTEDWKRRVGDKLRGRVISAETRAKLAKAAMGNSRGLGTKKSAEAIERTASAHRGVKRSAETRARISAIKKANPSFKGRHHTAESIAKIKAKQIGVPKSEQTKANMRKPKSEAHKQKLSEANIGKTHTDETRRLLSEKGKADWTRRKAAAVSNQPVLVDDIKDK